MLVCTIEFLIHRILFFFLFCYSFCYFYSMLFALLDFYSLKIFYHVVLLVCLSIILLFVFTRYYYFSLSYILYSFIEHQSNPNTIIPQVNLFSQTFLVILNIFVFLKFYNSLIPFQSVVFCYSFKVFVLLQYITKLILSICGFRSFRYLCLTQYIFIHSAIFICP